jgi:subtilisin-like proprotein convertase family protein
MNLAMGTRLALVVLVALLTLPLAPTASPVGAKTRSRTVVRTFRNSATVNLAISGSSPVSAAPYPSPIVVGGLKRGKIRDVNVRLIGLTHQVAHEVDVLLVGPGGQTAILMTHVGGFLRATDATLRLDDEATAALPSNAKVQSGHFRPTNAATGPVVFNAPAPAAGANASLSVFDGSNPNGTWRLFVQDRIGPLSSGSFAGGWELEITARVKAKKRR